MIEKCQNCNKQKIEPFGNCPIFSKLQQADELLLSVDLDTTKIQFNCMHFQQLPVLAAVTAFVVKNEKFLLGRRLGSHGSGTWALPGGKIDFGENWFNAAQREVLEETGLLTDKFELHGLTNDVFLDDKKHFVNVIISCKVTDDSEPRIIEKDKCDSWEWISCEDVKDNEIENRPLFLSLKNVLKVVDIKKICGSKT